MARPREHDRSEVSRFPSGLRYLDDVLGGGWLRGGVYLVAGPPGTGKTTLANQCAYVAAGRGERALYVTLLTESHDRMLLHLQSLAFFRRAEVGKGVSYVAGGSVLKSEGLAGFARLLSGLIRQKKATLLVVDGFAMVKELAKSPLELREHLQGLSVMAAGNDCTMLLLSGAAAKGAEIENAMVDGILALSADLHGLKATRGIEVIKLRGSECLAGKHTLRIGREGMQVYPRFESAFTAVPTRVPDAKKRLSWGIDELDAMSGGGLVDLSTTLILGSPGSGKTVIGMSFLAASAARGERSLYLGFAEGGEELIRKAAGLSIDLRPYVKKGLIRFESRAPVETLPDALAQELTEMVDADGYTRLFLDGLEPFAKESLDPERTTRFVAAMLNAMRERGVTTLVTQQTNELFGPELHAPIRGVEAICDNAVFLRFVELYGRLHRLIAVLKMRDSQNDPFLRELELSPEGVRVGASFTTIEALMTGQPRNRSGDAGPFDRRGESGPVSGVHGDARQGQRKRRKAGR